MTIELNELTFEKIDLILQDIEAYLSKNQNPTEFKASYGTLNLIADALKEAERIQDRRRLDKVFLELNRLQKKISVECASEKRPYLEAAIVLVKRFIVQKRKRLPLSASSEAIAIAIAYELEHDGTDFEDLTKTVFENAEYFDLPQTKENVLFEHEPPILVDELINEVRQIHNRDFLETSQ